MTDTVIKKIRTTSGDIGIEPVQASTTQLGGVKVDGTSITIDDNGVISSTSGGVGDGQWVKSTYTIIGEATTTTKDQILNFDLSNYIPKDGNQYEILLSFKGYLKASVGNYAEIIAKTELIDSGMFKVAMCSGIGTSSSSQSCTSILLPIGTNRTMSLEITGNIGGYVIDKMRAVAYRKIDLVASPEECADKNLSNITDEAKIFASGLGIVSTKKVTMSLGASGTTYIAPANGYCSFSKKSSGSNQYANINNQTKGTFNNLWSNSSGQGLVVGAFFEKGDTIRVLYNAGGETEWFNFWYLNGSESEAQ